MFTDLYTEDRLVYQFYPATSNQITFKIKAAHDAHIILAPAPFDGPPCYEVRINVVLFQYYVMVLFQVA